MAALILGWNPLRRNGWDYRDAVGQVAESGQFLARWSIGRRRNIRAGTEAWLLLQGTGDTDSGLIGHGVVMSEAYEAGPPGNPDTGHVVSVAFDALLGIGEQIRTGTLDQAVPAIRWASAMRRLSLPVPPSAQGQLRQVWRDGGPAPADPAHVVPGTYPDGAVSRIGVNRYELDPDARRACLAFHGTACAACGFSFEAVYGELGQGFVQVHHLVPGAMLGGAYRLDPIADLVPLCANCHAMAHLGASTPRSVPELRSIIAASGHLRGEVASDRALEAQEDARRILGGPPG